MYLILISIAISVLALAVGVAQRMGPRQIRPADTLSRRKGQQSWLTAIVLLACEVAGVLASFYITQAALKPGQNVVMLSLIVAAANFAGSLTARDLTAPLTPTDFLVFFKDGLLWPAALPTLARSLG